MQDSFVKLVYGLRSELEGRTKEKVKVGEILFLEPGDASGRGTLDLALCVGKDASGKPIYKYISNQEIEAICEKAILNDGTVAMEAALNLGNNKIINLAAGTANTDAVNVKQLNDAIDGVSGNFGDYLKLDGTNAMEAALDFGSHKGVNLVAGTADTDAVNVKQMADAISGAISNLGTVMEFLGATTTTPTTAAVTIDGKAVTATKGDVVVVTAGDDAGKEFLFDGSKWIKIGNENLAGAIADLVDVVDDIDDRVIVVEKAISWHTFAEIEAES